MRWRKVDESDERLRACVSQAFDDVCAMQERARALQTLRADIAARTLEESRKYSALEKRLRIHANRSVAARKREEVKRSQHNGSPSQTAISCVGAPSGEANAR